MGISILGGGLTGSPNTCYDDFCVIAGGSANVAGVLDGDPAAQSYISIGGGFSNTAFAQYATISGGLSNVINPAALGACIPGGIGNIANGIGSLAAGTGAVANHSGTFVWADTQVDVLASTGPDQVIVRAAGGVWIGDDSSVSIPVNSLISTSTGAYLSLSGIWNLISDRDRKEKFEELDGQEILDRIVALPVTQWQYKGDATRAKHIGPTAQDFRAVFGLGESDRHIASTDMAGVSLRGIQELHRKISEQQAHIELLEKRLAVLEAKLREE